MSSFAFSHPHFSLRSFLEGSMSNFPLRKKSPTGNGNVNNVSFTQKSLKICLAWWCTTIILALERLRQEDGEFRTSLIHNEFKTSLGYIVSPCLQTNKQAKNPQKLNNF
jgi:hypothetical protein